MTFPDGVTIIPVASMAIRPSFFRKSTSLLMILSEIFIFDASIRLPIVPERLISFNIEYLFSRSTSASGTILR